MKTIMKKNRVILVAALMCGINALADNDGVQIKGRVGYEIGGTAPVGIPATIRSIDAYRLTPSLTVGADVAIPLNHGWGVSTGLRLENKGMDADVTTKAYHMEMVKGDSKVEGLFSGHIEQNVRQWMLTLPVQATYTVGSRLTLRGGPYVSVLLDRDFSGIASDGYLRQGDPTGPKIEMGSREGEWATYDFSSHMRRLQLGVGVGADWQLASRFGLSAELSWGLTGIFKSSFKTVEQTLYPIYGTIGVFYRLK